MSLLYFPIVFGIAFGVLIIFLVGAIALAVQCGFLAILSLPAMPFVAWSARTTNEEEAGLSILD